jgi:fumarate hydratase class II
VNPVIAESVLMVAARVIGNDLTVTIGGQSGVFELNMMVPLIAHSVLESVRLLTTSTENLRKRCVVGIKADKARCNEMVERSLAMCTALAPEIGYDAAAAIAKQSYETGRTVREIAMEKGILPPERLNKVLDPMRMTMPGVAAKGE